MNADLVPHGENSKQLYDDLPAKVKGDETKMKFFSFFINIMTVKKTPCLKHGVAKET
jgi:hypothetical protein